MFKKTFLLFFVFYISTSIAQPPYSTIPFADDYKGKADLVIKSAKIKTQKTYFRLDEGIKDSILYIVRNYNAGGYLVNQKWYNLKSKKEMYSAHYEYDADNFFTNCVEKITKEFDDFDLFSRKITEDGFFINGTAENPLGETIPIDSEGNTVVKTIYQKDSLGGYVAKKYFQDDSFYKEKVCPFWDYGPKSYVGLFVNKNKTIDFFCSDKYYVADTLYNSIDTLNIRIKIKKTKIFNEIECFRVLKVKNNAEFIISEIDRVLAPMKLHFTYANYASDANGNRRTEIKSIAYLDYRIDGNGTLLVHKLQGLDTLYTPLSEKIELRDVYNQAYFRDARGCIYYTTFKNGYLYSEEQYALGQNRPQKLVDIYYENNNLIKEKIYYPACYDLNRFSALFNYEQKSSVQEINEYEYFK